MLYLLKWKRNFPLSTLSLQSKLSFLTLVTLSLPALIL